MADCTTLTPSNHKGDSNTNWQEWQVNLLSSGVHGWLKQQVGQYGETKTSTAWLCPLYSESSLIQHFVFSAPPTQSQNQLTHSVSLTRNWWNFANSGDFLKIFRLKFVCQASSSGYLSEMRSKIRDSLFWYNKACVCSRHLNVWQISHHDFLKLVSISTKSSSTGEQDRSLLLTPRPGWPIQTEGQNLSCCLCQFMHILSLWGQWLGKVSTPGLYLFTRLQWQKQGLWCDP